MNYQCQFSAGQWDPNEWLLVRSPRWEVHSSWQQEDRCIANTMPDDLSAEETQMGRERTGETYLSMLFKEKLSGSTRLETTCSFADRMAPLIVLSKELSPVHKEHLEIVLYDRGINLWHHFFIDGKPSWKLIGFQDLELLPNQLYRLVAEIHYTHKGKFLYMGVNTTGFGCRLSEDWPTGFYAGITACEGRNRFYNFAISDILPSDTMKERMSD